MSFPFNFYLLSAAGAFLFSALWLPVWRVVCRRIGLVDDPGHRKIHDTPIPLAGGFSVLTGMVVPLVLGVIALRLDFPAVHQARQLLEHGFEKRGLELGAIVLGAMVTVVTGLLDDKYELRPAVKFSGQFIAALLVALANARITLFVPSLAFSYAITILWMLTVINAFNFMDNMNGLCAGLGFVCSLTFGIISAINGQYLVGMMASLICGSLLGFLPYNFPKASAFLGDAGSHLVGYLLAVMAVLPHFSTKLHPRPWAVLTPLLVLAVPLGDLVCVVIIRWRLGRPFYVGDNNHLSHRLVKGGMSKTKAVVMIWLLAVVSGIAGILLNLIG
jgi:UDP-GlcNAc:undecaprenyl-phosphate GlcNAc-1-phosphate transferase